jgi:hypothetical protein
VREKQEQVQSALAHDVFCESAHQCLIVKVFLEGEVSHSQMVSYEKADVVNIFLWQTQTLQNRPSCLLSSHFVSRPSAFSHIVKQAGKKEHFRSFQLREDRVKQLIIGIVTAAK